MSEADDFADSFLRQAMQSAVAREMRDKIGRLAPEDQQKVFDLLDELTEAQERGKMQ